MGYNNNNAGMHMMWHSHYGKYDDLEYYDRLVAEQEKEKRLIAEKERQKQELEKKTKGKLASYDNKKKAKHKKKNNTAQKIQSIQKRLSYGTEAIISMEYFDKLSNIFRANLMIMALERKADIYGILEECEDIFKRDILTNPPDNGDTFYYPRLEKEFVFINMLADKLKCSVAELFVENKDRNKDFVYKLIDEELKLYWVDWFEIYGYDDNGVVFWINDFDRFYEMTDARNRFLSYMSLSLYKYITKDGKILYSISFGNFNMPLDFSHQHIFRGAFLWEEEDGKLKELIEEIIIRHKEELISETGDDYAELPLLSLQPKQEIADITKNDNILSETEKVVINHESSEKIMPNSSKKKKELTKAKTSIKTKTTIKLVKFDGRMSSLMKSKTSQIFIKIKKTDGEVKYLPVAFDKDKKEAYISSSIYSRYNKYFKGKVDFVTKIK